MQTEKKRTMTAFRHWSRTPTKIRRQKKSTTSSDKKSFPCTCFYPARVPSG